MRIAIATTALLVCAVAAAAFDRQFTPAAPRLGRESGSALPGIGPRIRPPDGPGESGSGLVPGRPRVDPRPPEKPAKRGVIPWDDIRRWIKRARSIAPQRLPDGPAVPQPDPKSPVPEKPAKRGTTAGRETIVQERIIPIVIQNEQPAAKTAAKPASDPTSNRLANVLMFLAAAVILLFGGLTAVVLMRLGILQPHARELWLRKHELCMDTAREMDAALAALHSTNPNARREAQQALGESTAMRGLMLPADVARAVNDFAAAVSQEPPREDEIRRSYDRAVSAMRTQYTPERLAPQASAQENRPAEQDVSAA